MNRQGCQLRAGQAHYMGCKLNGQGEESLPGKNVDN